MNLSSVGGKQADSNTPVLNTSIKMDYLAFTIDYTVANMESLKRLFDNMNWEELDYGMMRYANSAVIGDGGRVLWHPIKPEMGIHVRLGGKALGQVEMTALGLLNRAVDLGGKFKRIDIAFDDTEGTLDIDLMYRKILTGEVQSRWRKVTRISGSAFGKKEKLGDTVNIGARSSESFLRIYDKLLERVNKGKDTYGMDHWVRVELEMKGEKADVFGRVLATSATENYGKTAGELCAGLLLGLIDFKIVDKNDENKSRWKTADWWRKFVGSTSKLKLSIPKQEKTMDESKDWIAKTVSSTMAMIVLSEDDDNGVSGYDFIMGSIYLGQQKLSKEQQRRLTGWNEQQNGKKTDGGLQKNNLTK